MKRIAKTRMRMMMRAMSLLTEMLVCSSLACRSACMLYWFTPGTLGRLQFHIDQGYIAFI